MDVIHLENDFIKVKINPTGAELKSVYDKRVQREVLYEGNSAFWNRSAPVLFPIVGKLKHNTYTLEGKAYALPQHGFARDKNFTIEQHDEQNVLFSLREDFETLLAFPFCFELQIAYSLIGAKVEVYYGVQNLDRQVMPFSIGAHPAFNCPFHANDALSDYTLAFDADDHLERHFLDPKTGHFSGKTELIDLKDRRLGLHESLFEQDALVFKNYESQMVSLIHTKSGAKLKFEFPNFPYFAIWSKVGAPFICLEPWFGLADSNETSGNILHKEGIIRLNTQEIFRCIHTFEYSS